MADDRERTPRDDVPAEALVTPTTMTATDRHGLLGRSTLLRHSLAAVIGLVLLYLLVKSLSDAHNNQLTQIPAYVCAAVGLTLLVGLSGQISLGQGAFMMVGAYTFGLLWPKWSVHANLTMVGAF